MTATKVCSKCLADKEMSSFSPRKDSRDGRRSECINCMNEYKLNRTIEARGYVKRDPVTKEQQRIKKKISSKAWREANVNHLRKERAKWRKENAEKARCYGQNAAKTLSDRYVKNVISGKDRSLYKTIPQSLIEAKRINLQIKRLLKERAK